MQHHLAPVVVQEEVPVMAAMDNHPGLDRML
jgi:hypothetical protein